MTLTLLLLPVSLVFLLKLISILINTQYKPSINKKSPFECGFDPKSKARLPFSLQFFLLAVIFLIFDIEIVLILSLPIIMKLKLTNTYFLATSLFLIVLMLGLLHEWNEGSLKWKEIK